MSRISIELVPRSFEHLAEECNSLKEAYPSLDTLNIPDIMRMPIRSWEACRYANDFIPACIPHLRAIDFDLRNDKETALQAIKDFKEVLIVSGDPPQDFSRLVFPTTAIEMIAFIKFHSPATKVYAALDPYRTGIKQEIEYARKKRDAGADGFFTQPFFSIDLMKVYQDLLFNTEVFWGVSPVVGQKSKNYWESTNKAVFPSDYDFTIEGNQKFGRQALEFVRQTKSHIYFMPIRMKAVTYLKGVL